MELGREFDRPARSQRLSVAQPAILCWSDRPTVLRWNGRTARSRSGRRLGSRRCGIRCAVDADRPGVRLRLLTPGGALADHLVRQEVPRLSRLGDGTPVRTRHTRAHNEGYVRRVETRMLPALVLVLAVPPNAEARRKPRSNEHVARLGVFTTRRPGTHDTQPTRVAKPNRLGYAASDGRTWDRAWNRILELNVRRLRVQRPCP